MRPDVRVGTTFPDYELRDHTGTPRKLSELQGIDPMILVLSRGRFCPKDRLQMHALAAFEPELNVGYTRIVTISTDDLYATKSFREELGAAWPFLSDPERVVQRDLEIQEYTDPKNDPMVPYTLVLEPGLKIFRLYNGYWYWGRPSTAQLAADLRELTRRIRPDWDICDPELRGAWERGDLEAFYPYRPSRTTAAAGSEQEAPSHVGASS